MKSTRYSEQMSEQEQYSVGTVGTGRRDDGDLITWTRAQVIARLEDAGRVILAMPGGVCFPTGIRSTAPDAIREYWTAYNRDVIPLRPAAPTAREISRSDEAQRWLMLVGDKGDRRVVALRMLVHPINDRYLLSWRDIGTAIGCSHKTAKAKWEHGIDNIWYGLMRSSQKVLPQTPHFDV